MPFHHVAVATRDLAATRAFYTGAMGFPLVKVEAAPTLEQTGWARHVFFDTGDGQLFAVWDLHDDTIPEYDPAISLALGLPAWVNHVAFHAELDDLPGIIKRWLDYGVDVVELDHGFCRSVDALDPNRILVEWCADTRPLDADDRAYAERVLRDPAPELQGLPDATFHLVKDHQKTEV